VPNGSCYASLLGIGDVRNVSKILMMGQSKWLSFQAKYFKSFVCTSSPVIYRINNSLPIVDIFWLYNGTKGLHLSVGTFDRNLIRSNVRVRAERSRGIYSLADFTLHSNDSTTVHDFRCRKCNLYP
jgi:hypothetical protein